MQSRMLAPAVAVALAGLAAPGSDAAASGLTITNGTCFAAGQPVALSGTGFTAGAPVTLGGATSAVVAADVAGAFTTTFPAPRVSAGLAPRTARLTAADGANARNSAPPVSFRVVRAGLDGNYAQALNGPPAQRTTWRFAGFTPGRAIYGHLRSGGRARGRTASASRGARAAPSPCGRAACPSAASSPAAGGCRSTSAGAGPPARRRGASSPWRCGGASPARRGRPG